MTGTFVAAFNAVLRVRYRRDMTSYERSWQRYKGADDYSPDDGLGSRSVVEIYYPTRARDRGDVNSLAPKNIFDVRPFSISQQLACLSALKLVV
jgi:hypothetical protein